MSHCKPPNSPSGMTNLQTNHITVVGLCGSLRASSTNLALLKAARPLTPSGMTVISIVDGAMVPHFSPDYDSPELIPSTAAHWRQLAGTADGLILSTPEYAGGLPGTFKNALDWLVGEPRFYRKPIAIFCASDRSRRGQEALRLSLSTMSADIVESACISMSLLGRSNSELDKPQHRERILTALSSFAAAIAARSVDGTDR